MLMRYNCGPVSVQFKSRLFVGIIGRNGAGKSTLLKDFIPDIPLVFRGGAYNVVLRRNDG